MIYATALMVIALGVALWALIERLGDWLCDHDAKWIVDEEGNDQLELLQEAKEELDNYGPNPFFTELS